MYILDGGEWKHLEGKANIYAIGSPASGKGTLTSYLSLEHGIKRIEVGQIVGKKIAELYGTQSDYMKDYYKGILRDDKLAFKIVEEELLKNDYKYVIFDGFPRTRNQLFDHFESIGNKINKVILFLEIEDHVVIERMVKRVICSICKRSQIERENISKCVYCMSESLYKRKDDNLDSIKVRLSEFHNKTSEIFNIIKKEEINTKNMNIYYKSIDVNRSLDKIYKDIDQFIKF